MEVAEGMLPRDILQSGELLPDYTCTQSCERRPCGDILDKMNQVRGINQQVLTNLYQSTLQKLEQGEDIEHILQLERDLLTKLVEINERIIKRLKRLDKSNQNGI